MVVADSSSAHAQFLTGAILAAAQNLDGVTIAAVVDTDEEGVFLCTAHPAKFLEVIQDTLGIQLPLPAELAAVQRTEIERFAKTIRETGMRAD